MEDEAAVVMEVGSFKMVERWRRMKEERASETKVKSFEIVEC
jgi:hypothetical protein